MDQLRSLYTSRTQWTSGKPWLVVGKGPSLERIYDIPTQSYRIITLNDACQVVKPYAAHFIDMEALDRCAGAVLNKDIQIWTVSWPHESQCPGRSLCECVLRNGTLYKKMQQKKLFYYHISTAPVIPPLPDTIKIHHYSAEGVFSILASRGVQEIYSLGVDGGTGIYERFAELPGRPVTYEYQMPYIQRICAEFQVKWVKL